MKITINEKDIRAMVNECCRNVIKEWDDEEARMEKYYDAMDEIEMPECVPVYYRQNDKFVTIDDDIETDEATGMRYFEIQPEIVDYNMENNGIGSYEFWGSRGYDRGQDYIDVTKLGIGEVSGWCYDENDMVQDLGEESLTDEDKNIIINFMNKNIESICN